MDTQEVLEAILQEDDSGKIDGPGAVSRLGMRLQLRQAESLSAKLREIGYSIQPYDFPGTLEVWQSEAPQGVPYERLAIRELMFALAADAGVDLYEGNPGKLVNPASFRAILDRISAEAFNHFPINSWGTTLSSLAKHGMTDKVLAFVKEEHDFRLMRPGSEYELNSYDLKKAGQNTWKDKQGMPTEDARRVMRMALELHLKNWGYGSFSYSGMRHLLERLRYSSIISLPVNFWGTTARYALNEAYTNNVVDAVMDLIRHDKELVRYAPDGSLPVMPYDFFKVDGSRWLESGKPTDLYRLAFRRFAAAFSKRLGLQLDLGSSGTISQEGVSLMFSRMSRSEISKTQINAWGTAFRNPMYPRHAVYLDALAQELVGTPIRTLPRTGPYSLAWITEDPAREPDLGEHDPSYYSIRRILVPDDPWRYPIWGRTHRMMPYPIAKEELARVEADLYLWGIPLGNIAARTLLFELARQFPFQDRLILVTDSKNLNYDGSSIPKKDIIRSLQDMGYN